MQHRRKLIENSSPFCLRSSFSSASRMGARRNSGRSRRTGERRLPTSRNSIRSRLRRRRRRICARAASPHSASTSSAPQERGKVLSFGRSWQSQTYDVGVGIATACFGRFGRARSRLYQRRFLQPGKYHFAAFFEIYKS